MKDQVDGLRVDGVAAAVSEQHAVSRTSATRSLASVRDGPLPAALRLTRAHRRRRQRRRCGRLLQQSACGSSRSTRRTASASGATISGPSTGSLDACATIFRAFRCMRSPRRRPNGSAATSSRAPADRIRSVLRRIVRSAEPHLPRAASRQPASTADRYPRPRHDQSRASSTARRAAKSKRSPAGCRRQGCARFPTTPDWRTMSGAATRKRFSTNRSTSSSRPWRSGWASIDRTSGSWSMPARPRSVEHYQQESGRAGRDGLPAECVLIYSGADFVRWRQMLEANGEWNDSARGLLARHGALRRRHTLPAPIADRVLRPGYERGGCGACDWCLKELDAGRRFDDSWRGRSCRASRASKQTWGIRPCDRRPGRPGDRESRGLGTLAAVDVRPAQGRVAARRSAATSNSSWAKACCCAMAIPIRC